MALWCIVLALPTSSISAPAATFGWAGSLLDNTWWTTAGAALPDGGVVVACGSHWADPFLLAKWDVQGQLVWSHQKLPNIRNLAVSADGHVLVAGYRYPFHGRAEDYFDGAGIPYEGAGNAYVARILTSGEIQWVRLLGGTTNTAATSVAVDHEGNYFVGGAYSGTDARIGRETLPETAGTSAHHFFVARFNPDGEATWVRVGVGTYGFVHPTRVAVDPSGNVYLGASPWDSPYQFDDVSVPGRGPFVVKFDRSGKALWALNPSASFSIAVFAVDRAGNVFMAYSDSQFLRLDKYGPERALLWRKEIPTYDVSGTSPGISSLVVDNEEHCLVGGSFPTGTLSLGGTNLNTLAFAEAFVAKYSPDGELRWALKSDGIMGDPSPVTRLSFLALAAPGGFWAVSTVVGTVQFGDTTIHGPASYGEVVAARVVDAEANPPRLALRRTTDGVEAAWPAGVRGFTLEYAEDLDRATWTAVPGTPTIQGGMQWIQVTPGESARFFRLRKP